MRVRLFGNLGVKSEDVRVEGSSLADIRTFVARVLLAEDPDVESCQAPVSRCYDPQGKRSLRVFAEHMLLEVRFTIGRLRERSSTDFYHVMQRGVGLFDIFECNEDRFLYLEVLKRQIELGRLEVHSWCLMSNHTHLLVRAPFEELPVAMRVIGSAYARYFNKRYSRPGHLFQGRYNSVPVSDDPQFLGTMRYIHRNPVRHDSGSLVGDYPWSSFREYLSDSPLIARTDLVLGMLGGKDEFVGFHELDDCSLYLDIGSTGLPSDDDAREAAQKALDAAGVHVAVDAVGVLPKAERDKALRVIHSIGIGYRQMQRLTGVNYTAVRNAAMAQSLCPITSITLPESLCPEPSDSDST